MRRIFWKLLFTCNDIMQEFCEVGPLHLKNIS